MEPVLNKVVTQFWLCNSKFFSFPNPVTVTRIELKVKDTPIDYSYDVNYAVSGECLTLTAKKYFNEYLTPDDHISASSSIAYDLESVDIDGEGRIYQNGTNYQYDYYLKDHLGSTRMVVNSWDPGFGDMVKSQQLARDMKYDRLWALSPPERFFEKTLYGFTNSSDSRIPITDEFKNGVLWNPQFYLQLNFHPNA